MLKVIQNWLLLLLIFVIGVALAWVVVWAAFKPADNASHRPDDDVELGS